MKKEAVLKWNEFELDSPDFDRPVSMNYFPDIYIKSMLEYKENGSISGMFFQHPYPGNDRYDAWVSDGCPCLDGDDSDRSGWYPNLSDIDFSGVTNARLSELQKYWDDEAIIEAAEQHTNKDETIDSVMAWDDDKLSDFIDHFEAGDFSVESR